MPRLGLKKFGVIITAAIILISIFGYKLYSKPTPPTAQPTARPSFSPGPNDPPQIVSTKPDPLNETIISAAEIIEITFNRPLENVGEFKSRMEPKIEYKVELINDRKTARIIPAKPYELGATYNLYIGPDSKFDGVGEWKQDKSFHFRTIPYKGV
ncbi:Ig-like domain-containing protein [Candidatus Daviesbacteria bacterium]|nr:Ig-like domain-containing protein [Candidatus Daviesbacteria bacterium]